jgi:hypothetical protein
MKTFAKTIGIAWDFLAHPRKMVDKLLAQEKPGKYAWTFLLFSLLLWTLVTLFMNLVHDATARGREFYLGISMGPDIIISLLTIPLGIASIAAAAFLVSRVTRLFNRSAAFRPAFFVLCFTLNVGSTFFDLQYEAGMALTGEAWRVAECAPNLFWYSLFIMFAPILWSLILTVISIAHLYKIAWWQALVSFLVTVLPVFAILIFIVM